MRPLDPRLLRHARATGRFLAATVALGVAVAGLVIAQATLIADVVTDAFLGGADLAALRTPLLLLGGVVAGRAAVSWAQEAVAHASSVAVKSELRRRVLARAVGLGPGWLTGERSGELTTLVTQGIDALDGYFSRYLPQLVLAAIVPVAVLGRLAGADWASALTVALTLPLIPLFMALIGAYTQGRADRQWRLLGQLSGHFLDVVAGLPTLKVFGRAKAQAESVRAITGEYRRATMRTLRIAFLSSVVLELLATLSVALVAVSVGLRLVGGALDLRTALLVLLLAPEAYLPLRQVGAAFHASADGLAAVERVFEVLAVPLPATGRLPVPRSATIRVENVTVTYPRRAVPALSGCSLALAPGEVVVLAGPSGAGKSTLLAVLLGFVRPDAGRVSVAPSRTGLSGHAGSERARECPETPTVARAVDLADLDPDAWRRQLAWVPQRPYLFAGTVADNIRLGAPDANDDAVREAARLANADFVDSLPDGFETRLGDAGTGLSAGQRQRIALARAFLRDAPVLLLDEPTAHLDGESEAAVLDAVRRLASGRTVLLVTHSRALLDLADRVVTVPTPSSVGCSRVGAAR